MAVPASNYYGLASYRTCLRRFHWVRRHELHQIQPFSITILAMTIQALKPTRHNKTSALYDTVPLSRCV